MSKWSTPAKVLGIYAITLLVAWVFAESVGAEAGIIVGGVFIGLCLHAILLVARSIRADGR